MSILKPIYYKKITCVFCKNIFETKRVRSRFISVESVESDFCTWYREGSINPSHYAVDICLKCGYASTEISTPYFPPGSKETIAKVITANWRPDIVGNDDVRSLEEVLTFYKLALYTAFIKREKPFVLANLSMRLSWILRESMDPEEERFMNLARNYYLESYSIGDYRAYEYSEVKMLYLLGELARRNGEEKEAIRLFSKVVMHKDKEKNKGIIEKARDQWQLIRYKG